MQAHIADNRDRLCDLSVPAIQNNATDDNYNSASPSPPNTADLKNITVDREELA